MVDSIWVLLKSRTRIFDLFIFDLKLLVHNTKQTDILFHVELSVNVFFLWHSLRPKRQTDQLAWSRSLSRFSTYSPRVFLIPKGTSHASKLHNSLSNDREISKSNWFPLVLLYLAVLPVQTDIRQRTKTNKPPRPRTQQRCGIYCMYLEYMHDYCSSFLTSFW